MAMPSLLAKLYARPVARAIGALAVAVGIVFAGAGAIDWINPGGPAPPRIGTHTAKSIEMAFNEQLCGEPMRAGGGLAYRLRSGKLPPDASMREAVAATPAERADYCGRIRPDSHNDMALVLIMRALLAVDPGASVDGLVADMRALRLGLLAAFAWVLLVSGYGLVATGLVTGTAVGTDALLMQMGFKAALYPFLLPCALGYLALLAGVAAAVRRNHWGWVAVGAAAAGAAAQLLLNLRGAHYFAYAIGALLIAVAAGLAMERLRDPYWDRRLRIIAGAVLAFGAGSWGFWAGVVEPTIRDVPNKAWLHHTIMHPVVLGLGVPENELARREGIEWLDPVGEKLAQRVDPGVEYATPEYGPTLLAYWLGLWQRHPGEMVRVYATKLGHVGDSMERFLKQFLYPVRQTEIYRDAIAHVAIPPAPELKLNAHTVAAWVRFDPNQAGHWSGSVFGVGREYQAYALLAAPERLGARVGVPARPAANFITGVPRNRLADGTYHFVASTYDGSLHRLWLDGEVWAERKRRRWPRYSGPATAYIGADFANRTAWFEGTIDDVRIYDRALPATAMAALYAESRAADDLPRPTDSLVAHYPLNGSAEDASGNGLHGRAVNGPDFGHRDRFGNAGGAMAVPPPLSLVQIPMQAVFGPAFVLGDVIPLWALLLGIFALAAVQTLVWERRDSWLTGALAFYALLHYVEATLTISEFQLRYQAAIVVGAVLPTVVLVQAAARWAWRRVAAWRRAK